MTGDALEAYRAAEKAVTAPGERFALADAVIRRRNAKVYAQAATNLADIYEGWENAYADKDFIVFDGRHWTYTEIFDQARKLGAALRDLHGIKPGDRIGIATRNRPEWAIAFVAATRIGAIATMFNSRGTADELSASASQVDCAIILADQACAERLGQSDCAVRVLLLASDDPGVETDLHRLVSRGGADLASVRIDTDDPAMILFTSGTTGRPKGASLTHRNLCNMIHNLAFMTEVGLYQAAARHGIDIDTVRQFAPRPSVLLIMPVFHISGITNFVMAAIGGGQLVLTRRWNPAEAVDLIEKHKVTSVSGPSLIVADLLDQPDAVERMKSLNNLVVGGQATPVALGQRISRELPAASQAQSWGMTELSGTATSCAGSLYASFPGSCGVAVPLAEIRIVGDDGRELPPGAVGELLVRGALVMKGYWDAPEATAASFDADGWFRTGDIAYLTDEGLMYLVDRAKDMVISAGENIYCAEVERVLGQVDDFAEVAMFGVPDDRLGERAVVAIVAREGAPPYSEEDVKAIARQSLADYKVPAEVRFDLAPLPHNALGKVDKNALRAKYREKPPGIN